MANRTRSGRWRYPWLAVVFAFVAVAGVGLIAGGYPAHRTVAAVLGVIGIGQAWIIGHPNRSKPSAVFVAKFGVPLMLLAFLMTTSFVRSVTTDENSWRVSLLLFTFVSVTLFAIVARRAIKAPRE